MNRRLYRCRENRVIAGVASGVAEFFGLDPTLVRVLWFVSIFFGGVSLLLYIGLVIGAQVITYVSWWIRDTRRASCSMIPPADAGGTDSIAHVALTSFAQLV